MNVGGEHRDLLSRHFSLCIGMAILVALSFFFLLVSETMPASSRNSIIGELYAVTMVQMTVWFFLNVIVLRFHHMTEEEVPHWVKVRIILASFQNFLIM